MPFAETFPMRLFSRESSGLELPENPVDAPAAVIVACIIQSCLAWWVVSSTRTLICSGV